MNFIKGSHKTVYNYKKTEETNAVLLQEVLLDENEHDDDSYYYVNSMKAGECSIHADLLIHGSKTNISKQVCSPSISVVFAVQTHKIKQV